MKGSITRRGKSSWRLKFDVGRDAGGKRKIRYVTVRGKRQDAERELTKLLNSHHDGTDVEPSKITVAEYVRSWLDGADVAPKTLERYRQLAEQQIIPHLGATLLQKLRPAHVKEWHSTLRQKGGKDGGPLSARTVGHAHRLLHRVLTIATATEVVGRNVAAAVKPPKVESEEIEILTAAEMTDVLMRLEGHALHSVVTVALGTGMRRGELLGLQWSDLDFAAATLRVQRSVEETKQGLRLKTTKTRNGRRTISLPPTVLDVLRVHRGKQREIRMVLGLGRETDNTFVFGSPTGAMLSPDNLSRDWARTVKSKKLPAVSFHALRHTHASALIASGLDVVKISRRMGHASPHVTLTIYAHLFEKTDTAAASAIEATLRATEPA